MGIRFCDRQAMIVSIPNRTYFFVPMILLSFTETMSARPVVAIAVAKVPSSM